MYLNAADMSLRSSHSEPREPSESGESSQPQAHHALPKRVECMLYGSPCDRYSTQDVVVESITSETLQWP